MANEDREQKEMDRPDCPIADGIRIARCGSPDCGPHIIAFDENDKAICEIIIPRERLHALIGDLKFAAGEGKPNKGLH